MSELQVNPTSKNVTTEVLKALAGGTIIAGAVVAPNIASVLAFNLWGKKDQKLLRSIRYANSRGWLVFEECSGGVRVALSKSGKVKWQKIILSEPIKHRKWDGKWRIVLFDIPVNKKREAFQFRNSLKKLGFKQLQKSVWIIPYPCEKEIAALRQIYNIHSSTQLIIATHIENESTIKTSFNL